MTGWSGGEVLIVGAGIGGLTLALQLDRVGLPCRVVEAAPRLEPLGVGINILPHASRELHRLHLGDRLDQVAVRTKTSAFFNRFGQLIYEEPAGLDAGYAWPQYSIHRGDLHSVLLDAVHERLGPDAIELGARFLYAEQDDSGVTATVETAGGAERRRAGALVGCDGIHSAVRSMLHPQLPQHGRYSGYMMWRGATIAPPFLDGATMVRAGWLATGKMVVYPIRDDVDGRGNQLVNWVAELEMPQRSERDWNHRGRLADVISPFEDWSFDWLDVADLIRSTETILEYPMVDHEPLDAWSFGRITLLGDAAHPMLPRGSNGAGQAILDTRSLADRLADFDDVSAALAAYEADRREATTSIVLTNRTSPPDAILGLVYERSRDRPFDRIDDLVSREEMEHVMARYRSIAGFSVEQLATPAG